MLSCSRTLETALRSPEGHSQDTTMLPLGLMARSSGLSCESSTKRGAYEMAISIEYLDGVFADARGARTRRQEDAIIGSESKPPREGNDLWTKVRTPPPGSSASPGAGATVRHGRQYRTGDSSTHGGTKQLKLGIRHATSNIGWVLFDTTSRDRDGPLAYSTHHQHRYGHHGSPGTPERLPSRPTRVGDILSSCPMVRTMPISAAATT